MNQSWCVETDKGWRYSTGRLKETSQERKKLPIGTSLNNWMKCFIWSQERSEHNNQHEFLNNDGEIW